MKIFLAILIILVLLIFFILALPLHLILKKEPEQELFFEARLLFFKFSGTKEDGEGSFEAFKKLFSKNREKEKKSDTESAEKEKLTDKISKYSRLVSDIFAELIKIFGKISVNRLYITVVAAEENAAETAISYGRWCAFLYPAVGMLHSAARVKKGREGIDIICDYTGERPSFSFDFDISVRLFRLVGALLRISFSEIKKRMSA